jgi:hypothetical protein
VTSSRSLNLFSADKPIRTKAADLLGRSSFAESLAAVVEGWGGNNSLVIALYGPWGIGKTSIKNMVLEHLDQRGSEGPTVVEFTPWQWAAQDQLAEAFFREIALEAMTGKSVSSSSSDLTPREIWYIQLKNVERFIDPILLESRLDYLKPEGKNESQLRALKAFHRALDRRRRGKPDGNQWDEF